MSRIYEALQKAETERTSDEEAEHRRRPEENGSIPTTPPRFSSEPASANAVMEESYPFNTESEPSVFSGREPLDWASIPSFNWTPSVQALPALLERGAEVEQFRSLRSRVFELRDTAPLRSILISSGLPQEGKSFIAANLAISLARHKSSRVLLIDGDMRRYTLHRLLGCDSKPGLADYLSGKATALQVMQRPAELKGLGAGGATLPLDITFIPGGDGGDRAADLSGNVRFSELIQMASPHFDWIIVDSSPVIPVSDAVNLARSCDGVLLVARSGVTKYEVAQKAQAELKASRILGFVLNAVHQQAHSAEYYGYDVERE